MMNVMLQPMDSRDPTFGPFICRRFTLGLQGLREFRYDRGDGVQQQVLLPSSFYLLVCEAAATNANGDFGGLIERIKGQEATSRQLLREAVEVIETLQAERDALRVQVVPTCAICGYAADDERHLSAPHTFEAGA